MKVINVRLLFMLLSPHSQGELNFNTYGKGVDSGFTKFKNHKFCPHDCDLEHYAHIYDKPDDLSPCCQDNLVDYVMSSSSECENCNNLENNEGY